MVRPYPAHEELQAVVGRALIDPAFCSGLLNGRRADCLSEFNLSTEEMAAARHIKAADLTSYASELDNWITRQAKERRIRAVTNFAHVDVSRFTRALPAAA